MEIAFGEIKQWWPAAVELIYQNTAWHPGSESKVRSSIMHPKFNIKCFQGFTSAGGSRDSSVKGSPQKKTRKIYDILPKGR